MQRLKARREEVEQWIVCRKDRRPKCRATVSKPTTPRETNKMVDHLRQSQLGIKTDGAPNQVLILNQQFCFGISELCPDRRFDLLTSELTSVFILACTWREWKQIQLYIPRLSPITRRQHGLSLWRSVRLRRQRGHAWLAQCVNHEAAHPHR